MSIPIKDNIYHTIEYIKHPSTTPLLKFHGHIVKTFSELPSEGRLCEIVKRVALVVLSPFAYLVLALVALLGYPYIVTSTEKVPVKNKGNSSLNGLNPSFTSGDRSSLIQKNVIEEMLRTIGSILNERNISKIKYLVSCEISGQHKCFEIDVLSKDDFIKKPHFNESIEEPMNEAKKWLIEKFEIHGLEEEIKISGQAFCLSEDNIYHASWSAKDSSTKDSISFSTTSSKSTPDKDYIKEFLKHCFDELNINFPKKIETLADFFENKLISND